MAEYIEREEAFEPPDITADMNRAKKLFLTEAQLEMLGGDAVKQFLSRYDEIAEIPDDWEGE